MLKNYFIVILCVIVFSSWDLSTTHTNFVMSHQCKGTSVLFKVKPFTSNHTSFSSSTEELVYIKIFSQQKVQSFTLSSETGAYSVWANGSEITNTTQSPIIKLSFKNDMIEVRAFETIIGTYSKIKIASPDYNQQFRLKLVQPDKKPRIYAGNLIVETELGNLKLVNEIILDTYISGVVQAESGRRSPPEFYKVQAILARTFALCNIEKHSLENFNLCDHTHCQAYFGRTTESEIMNAVNITKNKVVVDENLNLIDAAFHSNSGGQTANSEDVWGKKLSYLRSVNDSFSVKMPNAKWERKMAKDDWLTYLKIKHNFPVNDSNARWLAYTFKQDSRKSFLEIANTKVPLKNVRTDLQLKSTFFSITPIGDSVLFKGRGFGHGVGMCQEGAMKMAKMGYKYYEMINFYYQNIQMIDLHQLNFFKNE